MQPNPALLLAKRFAKVKEAGKFIDRKSGRSVSAQQFPRLAPRGRPGLR